MNAAFGTGDRRRIDGVPVRVFAKGGREYWLARTGMGPQRANRAAARLFASQPFNLAVSTGFACALVPAQVGALLLGRDVVALEGRDATFSPPIEVPGDEREEMIGLGEGIGTSYCIGRFVSAGHVVGRALEKQRFARATGAIGLDMESAALGLEARRAGVPFVIVRTASDLLEEDLPLDFNLFLRPTGWLRGVTAVAGRPWSLAGLCRLRRQSQAAAENLTKFFRYYAHNSV